jgi:hypothetical protein
MQKMRRKKRSSRKMRMVRKKIMKVTMQTEDRQGPPDREETHSQSEGEYETQEEDGESWEDGRYVYVQVPMTFAALSAEFIACFRNLEELSVKYYDDRVRGFPAFAYQHNPLTRIAT